MSKQIRSRVWRACEVCRKRKVKCDGNDPCAYCVSCGKECTFKESNDNASSARHHAFTLDSRLTRVEETLRSLLPMVQAFDSWSQRQPKESDSLPFVVPDMDFAIPPQPSADHLPRCQLYQPSKLLLPMLKGTKRKEGDANRGVNQHVSSFEPEQSAGKWSDKFSHLAEDRYGNLRYLGGASSLMLVEALASLKEDRQTDPRGVEEDDDPFVPFVTPHGQFRSLKSLPKAEEVTYPPPELADSLVHAYFVRIHHTFPILQQTLFLDRYVETMESLHSGKPSNDPVYLACLFAVFACGSQVLPGKATHNSLEFEGLEYYERAQVLLLHGSSSYYIEHVQCLALLSVCSASWNTLAQSWLHAGHAVRRAQDLGLHRSCRRSKLSSLEKELRKRVWWCVYSLDRSLSISLGRPLAIHDDDCTVEYPAEVEDSQLLDWNSRNNISTTPSQQDASYMAGFIALLNIQKVAGKISRTVQSSGLEDPDSDSAQSVLKCLDEELSSWISSLPDPIRFASNISDPRLISLCIIAYFVYYAAIINLHGPFVPDPPTTPAHLRSLADCLSAARSCLRIGEVAHDVLPTSHHLAFAVQFVTLSAILLVRSVRYLNQPKLVESILTDVRKAVAILTGMQDSWPGTRRCREIVAGLLSMVHTQRSQESAIPAAPSPSSRKRKSSLEPAGRDHQRPRLAETDWHLPPCFDPSGMHGPIEPLQADAPRIVDESESFPSTSDIQSLFGDSTFSSGVPSAAQTSSCGTDGLPDFLGSDFFALLGSAAQSSELSTQDYQHNAEVLSGVLSPFAAEAMLNGSMNFLFDHDIASRH